MLYSAASPERSDRDVRWTILCLLAALVATCGQKGPLTLPEEPKAAIAAHFTR